MKTELINPEIYDFKVCRRKTSDEKSEFTLFKSERHHDCFIITVCNGTDFVCGSVSSDIASVEDLFEEMCRTDTPIYCVNDIILDFNKKTLL